MTSASATGWNFAAHQPPRAVVLVAGDREPIARRARELRPRLEQCVQIVLWDEHFAQNLDAVEAELVVVFGGDGSILRSARQMGARQRPVLGVNLGNLGFLADVKPEELFEVLPRVLRGECRVVEHLMFQTTVFRGDQAVARARGLNETAVLAGPPFAILQVELYVDGQGVTTYSCDGLIISTPVGSTAHSLSAGGPILRKDIQAFVICPVSPHTLTVRPVVDAAHRVYEMVVPRPNQGTAVVVDGQVLCRLEPGDRVRVERAEENFLLIEAPGHNYYRTLREKLHWSGKLHGA